jgi:hypothetical protein
MIKSLENEVGGFRLSGEHVKVLRGNFSTRYTNGNTLLASTIRQSVDAMTKYVTEDEKEKEELYRRAVAMIIHFDYPIEAIEDSRLRELHGKLKGYLDKHRSKQVTMELLCR